VRTPDLIRDRRQSIQAAGLRRFARNHGEVT
jgi:hypothetical protein